MRRGRDFNLVTQSSVLPGSTSARILEEVRQVIFEVLANQDLSVYLFGSWARGEATSISDIDVAIDPRNPLPRGLLAMLREQLGESRIPYRVEVVDLSAAPSQFRERVLKEGILWNG